jgi:hypothetical protein
MFASSEEPGAEGVTIQTVLSGRQPPCAGDPAAREANVIATAHVLAMAAVDVVTIFPATSGDS